MTSAATGRETISSADFFTRARARLSLDAPAALDDARLTLRGDHDLNPVIRELANKPARPAAVLVPVVARAEPTVLLTQRSAHLPNHAGQISFPGGKIEASDASPLDAALREAEEEIGLRRDHIEPIGYLDLYLSGTGFRIVPALARVSPGFALALNAAEVDDAFEVPLAFLMAEENHQRHTRELRGAMRTFYAMPFGERFIWGVTAGILRNLYERVYRG